MLKRISTSIILGILFVFVISFAGSFTPSPVSPDASVYSLSDIYTKLTSDSYIYSSHAFAPLISPASTQSTLTEIWNAIPPHKTLSAHSLDAGILGFGIYSTADLTTVEPNLIPENIAYGVTIFGVEGTYEVSGCDATCQSLRSGLVAYYPLDTDTDDYSGNNFNGTAFGAVGATGNVNGGYSFNGSSHVDIANNSSLQNFSQLSISSWVKLYDFGPCCGGNEDGFILAKGNGLWWDPTYALGYYKTGSPNTALFNIKGTPVHGTTALAAGTWYHFVGTYDGSTMKIYVNGNLEGTVSRSGVIPTDSCPLVISGSNLGGCGYQGAFTVNGVIDETALFDRALSETEVGQLYNGGAGRSLINN